MSVKKLLVVGLFSLASAASAMAGEVYAGLGTTGATVGYNQLVNSYMGVRGEMNYFKYNKNYTGEVSAYEADLNLTSAGTYVDYYPFAKGFRLSVGAQIGNRSVSLKDKNPEGVFTIDGQQYAMPGESISASIDMQKIAPFVGIGYSSTYTSAGLGWFIDAGVVYLKPEAKVTATAGLVAAVGADAIAREQRLLQDKLDNMNLFPVVRAGISYRF